MTQSSISVMKKWKPILEHEEMDPIKDRQRRWVTAQMLENMQHEMATENQQRRMLNEVQGHVNQMGSSSSTASDGNIDTYDPILISLVRRAMPNLIAYDICGVQPMKGPSGLIFAMRARYANQTGAENQYYEPNTAFATVVGGNSSIGQQHVGTLPGNTSQTINLYSVNLYNYGMGMSTIQGEVLGDSANVAWPQMGFSIEKMGVQAQTRALKAEYTMEIAQDLKTIHDLDAETELANILTGELLAEINREIVRTIYVTAVPGCQTKTQTTGVFNLDIDSNGRWMVEKFKGLMAMCEFESNQIAKETRRGKGNMIICSADVASALQLTGMLSNTPALNANNLQVDDTGNTFVGVLNNRFKVFIDPYATGGDFAIVGFKGQNAMDAGLFYCPYVPLQMVRAVDPGSFQPKIGFKTRYGVVANPFAEGATVGGGRLIKDSNVYYRRIICQNIL